MHRTNEASQEGTQRSRSGGVAGDGIKGGDRLAWANGVNSVIRAGRATHLSGLDPVHPMISSRIGWSFAVDDAPVVLIAINCSLFLWNISIDYTVDRHHPYKIAINSIISTLVFHISTASEALLFYNIILHTCRSLVAYLSLTRSLVAHLVTARM